MNKGEHHNIDNKDKEEKKPGYVYIIESPAASDLMKGTNEGKIIQEALNLIGVGYIYKLVVDRCCFEKAIKQDLKAYLRKSEINPIVHVSAHGMVAEDDISANKSWLYCPGIALTDGETMYWDDLRGYLTDINQFVDGNLMVCMSCCYGFGASSMGFTRSKKLPYFALVGNTGEYYWSESGIAFATFYHQFFRKSTSLEQAVKKMCSASGNNNFKLIHAEDARAFWLDINRRSRHIRVTKHNRR